MKIIKGWRKIDRQRGFVNEITGQNLIVSKKEFGEHFVVLLFPRERIEDNGETVSPAYATASKAEAYALNWMEKHPGGAESAFERASDGVTKISKRSRPMGKAIDRQKGHQTRRARGGKKQKRR